MLLRGQAGGAGIHAPANRYGAVRGRAGRTRPETSEHGVIDRDRWVVAQGNAPGIGVLGVQWQKQWIVRGARVGRSGSAFSAVGVLRVGPGRIEVNWIQERDVLHLTLPIRFAEALIRDSRPRLDVELIDVRPVDGWPGVISETRGIKRRRLNGGLAQRRVQRRKLSRRRPA